MFSLTSNRVSERNSHINFFRVLLFNSNATDQLYQALFIEKRKPLRYCCCFYEILFRRFFRGLRKIVITRYALQSVFAQKITLRLIVHFAELR